MERLTRYGDIYNRLAELEDKLENGTLVEVKPLDIPTWEELQKKVELRSGKIDWQSGLNVVKIKCNYGRIYIYVDENSMELYVGNDCHSYDYSEWSYKRICEILETYREKLIKELCGE